MAKQRKQVSRQSGFIELTVLLLIILVVSFFAPTPRYYSQDVLCKPCVQDQACAPCPKKGDILWEPSIFQRLFFNTNKQQTTQLEETNTSPAPTAHVSPEPKTTPIYKIKTESTKDWETIELGGIVFKIPPGSRFEKLENDKDMVGNERSRGVLYFSQESFIPDWIFVSNYQGKSRRLQFLGENYADCHYIFQEAMFGSIKALQVAADGGWCQGGAGGIVAVAGNKLFVYQHLYYDLKTKEIQRSIKTDTLISTLKAQN